MNESKVIISSTLDPKHLFCDFLDVDKMTLLGAVFRTRKMTWGNKQMVSLNKISVKKTTIVTIPNIFGRRKDKLRKRSWVPVFIQQSFFSLKS